MFDTKLLNMLCCPETRCALKLADVELLNSLNARVEAKTLKNIVGEVIAEKIEEALVTEDNSRAYIIREGIPVLLADEAIQLGE